MIRKIIYTTGSLLLAFFVGLAIYDTINSSILTNKISIANKASSINSIYDINIKPTKTGIGNVKIFEPTATEVSVDKAITYAGLFGLKQYSEDNNNYYFSDYFSTLTIKKSGGLLQYTSKSTINEEAITAEQARNIAEKFVKEKNLPLDYSDAQVEFFTEDKIYSVKFLNTIENKKNYAYPKIIEVDEYGNVITVSYFYYSYKPIGEVKGISLQRATDILTETEPLLEDALDGNIDIKSAELVYYLTDDMLYPYYRFSGLMYGGYEFESLVPAYSSK